MLKKFEKSGFTLIELMVTITIMMLMVGGGIAAYFNFNDRQTLAGDAKGLQTFLRSAQKKARVGEVPAGCEKLENYSVGMTTGDNTVLMRANCTNGVFLVNTLYLSDAVTAQSDFEVEFRVLHGGADFITGNGSIVLVTSTRKYEFQVSAGGTIEDGTIEDLTNP